MLSRPKEDGPAREPLHISGISINPPLILAPMAGLSHAAFRELVASFGGCGLFLTEMLNSRIVATQKLESDPYLIRGERDRPLFAQVAGNDPQRVALAFERLQDRGWFDGFDLNMACPRGVIQRFGWGVALMGDMEKAREVLRAARRTVKGPLTVKIRSGPEHDLPYLKEFCRMLEGEGADALVLHPRSARDRFGHPARWEEIREVKETASIPVIGNGDVFGPQDALKMVEETGCDGVMVGRAALLRPWIFRDIVAVMQGKGIPPAPSPAEVIERFFRYLEAFSPPELRRKRLLLFSFWFLQNFPFGLYYYRKLQKEDDSKDIFRVLKEMLEKEDAPYSYPARPIMMR